MNPMTLSVVIPTYRRGPILVETLHHLFPLMDATPAAIELLLIDQTEHHRAEVEEALQSFADAGRTRWIRLDGPQLTVAMNRGLLESRGDLVLFLDDDIVPRGTLLQAHVDAHQRHPDAWAVVGQVLQPGEQPEDRDYVPRGGPLRRYMDFPFRCSRGGYIENAIACNLSVRRLQALRLGGFDQRIPPPVAARFESEFAKRLVAAGGKIWFEPAASIRHLAAQSGGTRSQGHHLASAKAIFGVGDYYFALRCGVGWERLWYVLRKPLREVRTRFHLRHPWWIPVKLLGEGRAFLWALRLYRQGPVLLDPVRLGEDRKS